jgi:hypothetical protein
MKTTLALWAFPILLQAQGLDFLKKWKATHDAKIEKRQVKRQAKYDAETVYRTNLVGVALQTQQNTNFGKNQYLGAMIHLGSSRITEHKTYNWVTTSQLGAGLLGIDNYDPKIYSFASQSDMAYLFKLGKGLSLGPNIGTTANVRLNPNFENNAFGMEVGTDLGAKARISKDFKVFGVAFKGQYMLTLPVVAFVISLPSRTLSIDPYDIPGGLRSLRGYQRIGSNMQLAWQHSRRFPNRSLALNYNWSVQRIALNEANFAAVGSHSVGIIGHLTKIK